MQFYDENKHKLVNKNKKKLSKKHILTHGQASTHTLK